MIKVNKKVEYALMSLKYMAEKPRGELSSAREICELFHTPFDTMSKVMQIMNTHGILSSVKGVKGGYIIEKDLATLSFMELTHIIEGKTSNLNCSEGGCGCKCNIKDPMAELNHRINKCLEKVTIKELLLQGSKS